MLHLQNCTTGTINGKDVAISAACGAAGGLAGGAAAGVCSAVATAGASSSLAAAASLSSANVVIGTGIISGGASSYASTAMRQSLYGYSDPNELIDNTLFGATTGGALGAATWGMANSSNIKAWLGNRITPGASLDYPTNTGIITNDILECPRTGSALKVDYISPIRNGQNQIIKEFPSVAQAHGFNDIVDNYAGFATQTPLQNATLYQLDGALNGVTGRYEWIIQDGYVTHRMFVEGGTINGVPIQP